MLVVDRNAERRAELERVLNARYLNTLAVAGADEALAVVAEETLGMALLAVSGDDEADLVLCRSLKAASGNHLPVLVYAEDEADVSRRAALKAGVDDALVFPRDEILLLARTRSLLRVRTMAEELSLREKTAADLGLSPEEDAEDEAAAPCSVLLVAPDTERTRHIAHTLTLRGRLTCAVASTGFEAFRRMRSDPPDAIIVSGAAALNVDAGGFSEAESPNELIQAISATEAGRRAAVLYLTENSPEQQARTAAALDAGAADCAFLDAEAEELSIRLNSHLRRKRYADRLRARLASSLQDAVRDPLTGLHNRRYLDAHFERRIEAARETGEPLSAIIFDLDHFKTINDRHGHMVGDSALVAFARALSDEVRVADLVCRYGGEEFVVIMPGATLRQAAAAGERVRARVSASRIPELRSDALTVSAGVAELCPGDRASADLLERADAALRRAKENGRNQISLAARSG